MSENPANESKVSRAIIFSSANVDESHGDMMATSVAGAVSSINFNEQLGCFEEVVVNDTNQSIMFADGSMSLGAIMAHNNTGDNNSSRSSKQPVFFQAV